MNELKLSGKTYSAAAVSGDKLMSAGAILGDALAAESLSVDTMTAVIRDYDLRPELLAADGLPAAAEGQLLMASLSDTDVAQRSEYGQPVEYYHQDQLFARMYLESVKRTGRYQYQLSCVSAIGLLLTDQHYGGMYTGETAVEVVADIVAGAFPYDMDAGLGATQLYGWLPKGARRDNLRDVLFVTGGQIRKSADGRVQIVPQSPGTSYEITADEFYLGGSVTGGNPATGIDLTEHAFVALPSDERVTLFSGAVASTEITTPKGQTVSGTVVEFGEPFHDLAVEKGSILEQGVNYAVLAPAPDTLLTGQRYTHSKRIVSRRKASTGQPNIVQSHECTLVNLMNSELVADRLMAYYGAAKEISADLVLTTQKPGDAVVFTDPFGDAAEGYISSLDVTMSAILKAAATIVTGYIPSGSGNYYSHVAIITESGSWAVPAEGKGKILAVIVGAGDGGLIGTAGESGGRADYSSYGRAGAGGKPGTPGKGGKIFTVTIDALPGTIFPASIGKGGKGQTVTSAATAGGATTFGSFSSADGFSSDVGVTNILDGTVYAIPGIEGIPGGAGSTDGAIGPSITYKGKTYIPGAKGADDSASYFSAYGGYGGGAAAGANGSPGGAGYSDEDDFAYGGLGGNGATPVKADNGSIPGQGGGAGHGGGGGGGGGPATGNYGAWPENGGDGGQPGEAGDGADGIILVYY